MPKNTLQKQNLIASIPSTSIPKIQCIRDRREIKKIQVPAEEIVTFQQSDQRNKTFFQMSQESKKVSNKLFQQRSFSQSKEGISQKELLFLKVRQKEYRIQFSDQQSFEISFQNAISGIQMKRKQALATKIFLLHRILEKNPKLKDLLQNTLQLYAQYKYQNIIKKEKL